MRAVGALAAALLLAGCGSDHAGLHRSDAIALSNEIANAFPQVPDEFLPYPRRARLAGIYPSTTLDGAEAWLAIYRFHGENFGPDEACVWVAAGPYGAYLTAQVPTIAWGRATPLHERCLDEVQAHGFFDPDQTAGDESPRPTVAIPAAMSPLGVLPPVGYRSDWVEAGTLWLGPYAMRFPATTAPRTWGVAGFVADADGGPIPHALIRMWPTGRPRSGVSMRADEKGAYAFLNMPPAPRYEVVVEAPGFVSRRSTEEFGSGEVFSWEIGLLRPGDPALPY